VREGQRDRERENKDRVREGVLRATHMKPLLTSKSTVTMQVRLVRLVQKWPDRRASEHHVQCMWLPTTMTPRDLTTDQPPGTASDWEDAASDKRERERDSRERHNKRRGGVCFVPHDHHDHDEQCIVQGSRGFNGRFNRIWWRGRINGECVCV
jgi:hypothetical protein